MNAAVLGVVGSVADGLLADQGGLQGVLSNADLNQMAEQLNMSDPSNIAYAAWCKEYAPDKIDGTSSIWNAPGDVNTFRERVTALPGYGDTWFWGDVIGKIDGNYQVKVNTSGNTGGGAGGSGGGGGAKGLDGKFIMLWPWERGAFKAASWYHWVMWAAMLVLLGFLIFRWIPRMFRKRKSWKRPKWMRMKSQGSIR